MKVGGEVTPETLDPFKIKVYELTESCIHVMARTKPTMDDMFVDILNLGAIFGVDDKAKALVAGYEKGLADIKSRIGEVKQPVRVFVYDSGTEKPFTSGRFGIPTAMIEAAGGANIMEDVEKNWAESLLGASDRAQSAGDRHCQLRRRHRRAEDRLHEGKSCLQKP